MASEEELRAAQISKLQAEETHIRGSERRADGQSRNLWQQLITPTTVIASAIGVIIALKKASEDAAAKELRRWRTVQGGFELSFDLWQRDTPANVLPTCESARFSRRNLCPGQADIDARGGAPILCVHTEGGPKLTVYRRLRCWQNFANEMRGTNGSFPTVSASLTALDFNFADQSADGGIDVIRNPRLQLFVPIQEIQKYGFEVDVQTWNNSDPYMIGIAWSATGIAEGDK
jgi:hypothetical protein